MAGALGMKGKGRIAAGWAFESWKSMDVSFKSDKIKK